MSKYPVYYVREDVDKQDMRIYFLTQGALLDSVEDPKHFVDIRDNKTTKILSTMFDVKDINELNDLFHPRKEAYQTNIYDNDGSVLVYGDIYYDVNDTPTEEEAIKLYSRHILPEELGGITVETDVVLVDSMYYFDKLPETFVVDIMERMDGKDGLHARINNNIARDGSHSLGKVFFIDRSWQDAQVGRAEVRITREMPNYGFISGRMLNSRPLNDIGGNSMQAMDESVPEYI